ncbi:hypothetical protein BT93_E2823 [Corymbia citriodora subsp. variegata]|nr:hypothetical protein BT93_E2823 [Corymbia citriodora subsp. variegata]
MARNWADLPEELLRLCSRCLCPKDLWAFRAVCRSWQSAAPEERSYVPWLMFAENTESPCRDVFCPSCRRVHLAPVPAARARRCFSSRGWLFTLGLDMEIHMLKNPIYIVKLPDLDMFSHVKRLPYYFDDFDTKFVLSASPSTSSDYMVMIIYGKGKLVGLWRPGGEAWTAVNFPSPRRDIWDVIFYDGCFVAIDYKGSILRCDVDGPAPFEARVIFEVPGWLMHWEHPDLVKPGTGHLRGVHLVQSTRGSLLFVSRLGRRKPLRFRVFEIDLNARTCREVKSLGNASLFLGPDSGFSLESDEKHRIEPNCIYFTDDSWGHPIEEGGNMQMRIYHIEDRTTKQFPMATFYDDYSYPLWIEPSF